jgi:hypothetical protein
VHALAVVKAVAEPELIAVDLMRTDEFLALVSAAGKGIDLKVPGSNANVLNAGALRQRIEFRAAAAERFYNALQAFSEPGSLALFQMESTLGTEGRTGNISCKQKRREEKAHRTFRLSRKKKRADRFDPPRSKGFPRFRRFYDS